MPAFTVESIALEKAVGLYVSTSTSSMTACAARCFKIRPGWSVSGKVKCKDLESERGKSMMRLYLTYRPASDPPLSPDRENFGHHFPILSIHETGRDLDRV